MLCRATAGAVRFRTAATAATLGDVLLLALTVVTDARTDAAHLVIDNAVAAGRRTGSYTAVCGAPVLAGSLTAPPGQPCRPRIRAAR